MLSNNENYHKYLKDLSDGDLQDILRRIDSEKYPEKLRLIENEIGSRKPSIETRIQSTSTHRTNSIDMSSFMVKMFGLYVSLLLIIGCFFLITYVFGYKSVFSYGFLLSGLCLIFVGFIITGIFHIHIVGIAFQKSVSLGCICLMIPFISLFFIEDNHDALDSFGRSLFGLPFIFTGVLFLVIPALISR